MCTQVASGREQAFANGTWGGKWHPELARHAGDIVVKEHWGGSRFVNTGPDVRSQDPDDSRTGDCAPRRAVAQFELGWYVLDIPLGKDALEGHGLTYRSVPARWPDLRVERRWGSPDGRMGPSTPTTDRTAERQRSQMKENPT